jgi:hypothetical protein
MLSPEFAKKRIINQKIAFSEFNNPVQITKWMTAVQAQDYPMAKWALGLRLPFSKETDVEASFNKGEILRTHLLRPTWHFVAAEDIRWISALTAPGIKSVLKASHKNHELTGDVFKKCNKIIEKAFLKEKFLTREDLAFEFEKARINTADNRLSHILMNAELDGLICSGIIKNRKISYALLDERVPKTKLPSRSDLLGELAMRYFKSRNPATLQDFIWWSGLSAKDARLAYSSVQSHFVSKKIGEEEYLIDESFTNNINNGIFLLPAYDEFLISYRSREFVLSSVDNKKTISSNGIFHPIIIIDGIVKGVWRRIIKKDVVMIEIGLFSSQGNKFKKLIEEETKKFGLFLAKKTEIKFI